MIFSKLVHSPHLNSLCINQRFSFEVLETANTGIIWLITWLILATLFLKVWRTTSFFFMFFTDLFRDYSAPTSTIKNSSNFTICFTRKMSWDSLWFGKLLGMQLVIYKVGFPWLPYWITAENLTTLTFNTYKLIETKQDGTHTGIRMFLTVFRSLICSYKHPKYQVLAADVWSRRTCDCYQWLP